MYLCVQVCNFVEYESDFDDRLRIDVDPGDLLTRVKGDAYFLVVVMRVNSSASRRWLRSVPAHVTEAANIEKMARNQIIGRCVQTSTT